jgi:hypothetical protein
MAKKQREGSLQKSARLILLLRWQDTGKLDGKGGGTIAKMFPENQRPSRFTILRDIADLPALREMLKTMGAE